MEVAEVTEAAPRPPTEEELAEYKRMEVAEEQSDDINRRLDAIEKQLVRQLGYINLLGQAVKVISGNFYTFAAGVGAPVPGSRPSPGLILPHIPKQQAGDGASQDGDNVAKG